MGLDNRKENFNAVRMEAMALASTFAAYAAELARVAVMEKDVPKICEAIVDSLDVIDDAMTVREFLKNKKFVSQEEIRNFIYGEENEE